MFLSKILKVWILGSLKKRKSALLKNSRLEVFCQKKVSLEISQVHRKTPVPESLFFDKVTGLRPVTLLKNKLWYSCFPVNFVKFSRRLFFAERLRLLPLIIYQQDVLSGFNDAFISKHKKTRLLLFSQLLTMYKKW